MTDNPKTELFTESAKGHSKQAFSRALKSIRKELGLSQPALADLIDTSVDSIKNWENIKKTTMPHHIIYYQRLTAISGWSFDRMSGQAWLGDERRKETDLWHPALKSYMDTLYPELKQLNEKLHRLSLKGKD